MMVNQNRKKGFGIGAAFQFGFDFDSDDWVYQEEIEEDLPFFTADAIGASHATDGNLKIAWYDTTTIGRTLGTSEKMLSLEFEDEPWVSGGSILTELVLNETDIQAVAYKEDGTPLVIRLVKETGHRLPYPIINGIEESHTLVEVQPNPTNGEVIFNINAKEAMNASLIIFDTQGKQLFTTQLDLGKGRNTYQLQEIQAWPTGLYWYRLESNTESLSGKILKK